MNNEIRNFLAKEKLVIKKIKIKENIIIIYVLNNMFVVKKKDSKLEELFKYLNSRSFFSFPKIIYKINNYDFYEYITDVDMPDEQRAIDIVKLVSSLHNKTTFYKDVDEDYYKKIYEDVIDKLNYLENYYNDMAEIAEKEEFMSPSQYLFVRNISIIFISINYARYSIQEWYKIINDKKRIRIVNLHNNLSLDHYLVNSKPYFVSWSLSKKDMPIYDLLKIYKKYYLEFDFYDLLKNYEVIYPWLLEEKRLFFSLISIPEKMEFNESEYSMCEKLRRFYNYLSVSQNFINDYFPQKKKEQ